MRSLQRRFEEAKAVAEAKLEKHRITPLTKMHKGWEDKTKKRIIDLGETAFADPTMQVNGRDTHSVDLLRLKKVKVLVNGRASYQFMAFGSHNFNLNDSTEMDRWGDFNSTWSIKLGAVKEFVLLSAPDSSAQQIFRERLEKKGVTFVDVAKPEFVKLRDGSRQYSWRIRDDNMPDWIDVIFGALEGDGTVKDGSIDELVKIFALDQMLDDDKSLHSTLVPALATMVSEGRELDDLLKPEVLRKLTPLIRSNK